MSITYDLDCGDETITLELLDDGTLISYGFDIESELIAKEMGFEPHPCFEAMYDQLCLAVESGYVDIVKLLISAGADIHKSNDYVFRLASEFGHEDVVQLLLEHGADVHSYDDLALKLAVRHGYTNTVKVLLEHGADVNAANYCVIKSSVWYDHDDIIKIIEDWIRDHG